MEIIREYKPRPVNWILFRDLLERIQSSIPIDEIIVKKSTLIVQPEFFVETFSQKMTVNTVDDFLNFISDTIEHPTRVIICLNCLHEMSSGADFKIDPPYFKFSWNLDRIFVKIARNTTSNAMKVLDDLEESLQLEPAAPPEVYDEEQRGKLQRSVFIAHSFDEGGRSYAYQLMKFFSLIGFEIATGEGFSPEKVSSKVKRRLQAQEIVTVILSDKQDATWLTQEIVGADFNQKPIILLVEEGVEFKPGILGDLEYIPFPKNLISEAITPILEGLRELGYRLS